MKRIFTAMCALALALAGCTPALAAEAPKPSAPPSQEPERSCYYQIGRASCRERVWTWV